MIYSWRSYGTNELIPLQCRSAHRQIVSPAQLQHGYHGSLEEMIRPEDPLEEPIERNRNPMGRGSGFRHGAKPGFRPPAPHPPDPVERGKWEG